MLLALALGLGVKLGIVVKLSHGVLEDFAARC